MTARGTTARRPGRRGLLAAAPLAVLLAACDPSVGPDGGGAADGGWGPSAGPSPTAAPPVEDPSPRLRGERAEVVDYRTLRLPLEMTPMVVVAPGWTATPLELDGIFLGYREEEDRVVFLAVDQDGTVLWEADRPLSCTALVLTRDAAGAPVAVLTDLAPSEDPSDDQTADPAAHPAAATSLTAYHLRTAEQLWGPVPAAGPQAAVGLVHAPSGRSPQEASGPRSVLDPGTGEMLLSEVDLGGGRILAEHLGTVLHTDGPQLVAVTATGQESWRIDLPAGIAQEQARVPTDIDPNTGFVVLAGADGAGAVLDIADGRTVAEDALAVAHDHVLDVTVVAAGTTVRGLDADGAEQWRHSDPEPLHLLCAGERLAYAIRPQEGSLVVLDTGRGLMVQPYDVDLEGPLGVPEVFSAETAAAISTGEQRCLVTTEFDPHYGRREQ